MPETDVIKSYLISLGFEADDAMYRKFSSTLAKTTNEVLKGTSLMSEGYIKAGAAVAGTIGVVVASTAMMLDSLAKADLGYEKYAMKMFMAVDAAKQFSIVTKAMGESLDDISWHPELLEKYGKLMEQVSKMELPEDYKDQMKMVRDIGFEFTRMKVESVYGLQWIGYNIIKNLSGPMGDVRGSLEKFNEYMTERMPMWSSKLADALTSVLQVLKDNVDAVGELGKGFKRIWDDLPPKAREALGWGAAGAVGLAVAKRFPLTATATILPPAVSSFVSDIGAAREGKETLWNKKILAGWEYWQEFNENLAKTDRMVSGTILAPFKALLYGSGKWVAPEGASGLEALWKGHPQFQSREDIKKHFTAPYEQYLEEGGWREAGSWKKKYPNYGDGSRRYEELAKKLTGGLVNPRYASKILEAAEKADMDPFMAMALIMREGASDNPADENFWGHYADGRRSDARGPAQFIKSTGRKYGLITDEDYAQRWAPAQAKYLKDIQGEVGLSVALQAGSYYSGKDAKTLQRIASGDIRSDLERDILEYMKAVTDNYARLIQQSGMKTDSHDQYEVNVYTNDPKNGKQTGQDLVTVLESQYGRIN